MIDLQNVILLGKSILQFIVGLVATGLCTPYADDEHTTLKCDMSGCKMSWSKLFICEMNLRQKHKKQKYKTVLTGFRYILSSRDREEELQLIIEELKLYHDWFWTYFRVWASQFKALLQTI